MKSNSSLSLFKSFRFIAATPGGLGQVWRVGKEREPLRKQRLCSLTAGGNKEGHILGARSFPGCPGHMRRFHIPVSVPGGDGNVYEKSFHPHLGRKAACTECTHCNEGDGY